MKKNIYLIVSFVFTLCLAACDPAPYHFDKEHYGKLVDKIELRYSEITDIPKNITCDENNVPYFDIQNSKLVECLESDKIDVFINDLSLITFHRFNNCVNSPFGYIVIMFLTNGNYIIASCSEYENHGYGIFAEFDSNDAYVQCLGDFTHIYTWEVFLSNHFQSYVIEEK